MLVITRKIGQEIWIGDDIRISIREVRGRQVRIAISAPQGVSIVRPETVPTDRTADLLALKFPTPSASAIPRIPSSPQLPAVKPMLTLPEDIPPAKDVLAALPPRPLRTNRRPPRVL